MMRRHYIAFVLLFVWGGVVQGFGQRYLGIGEGVIAPVAFMDEGPQVRLGTNWLEEGWTPEVFAYSTLNYYLSATLLPFFEASYGCTLFRGTDSFVPQKKGKFVNQDRSFSCRLRLIRRRGWSVVVGSTDLYSQVGGGQIVDKDIGNKYFSSFYGVVGKEWSWNEARVRASVGYTYENEVYNSIKAMSVALNYRPCRWVAVKADVAKGEWAMGAELNWKGVELTGALKEGGWWSAGVCYVVMLKRKRSVERN